MEALGWCDEILKVISVGARLLPMDRVTDKQGLGLVPVALMEEDAILEKVSACIAQYQTGEVLFLVPYLAALITYLSGDCV